MPIWKTIKHYYRRLRWALGRYGAWPAVQVTQEDLHGGIVEITFAGPLSPRRVERYDLGPNVGDHEFTQMMRPLRPGTLAWRARLQWLAEYGPWTPAMLAQEGIGR